MSKQEREIAARGPEWEWLIHGGPHGPSFEWGQTPRTPRAHRDHELLSKMVAERTAVDPSFRSSVRAAAVELLTGRDPGHVRRAIQVLSVVGSAADVEAIREFLQNRDPEVRKDARACLFELGGAV